MTSATTLASEGRLVLHSADRRSFSTEDPGDEALPRPSARRALLVQTIWVPVLTDSVGGGQGSGDTGVTSWRSWTLRPVVVGDVACDPVPRARAAQMCKEKASISIRTFARMLERNDVDEVIVADATDDGMRLLIIMGAESRQGCSLSRSSCFIRCAKVCVMVETAPKYRRAAEAGRAAALSANTMPRLLALSVTAPSGVGSQRSACTWTIKNTAARLQAV